MANSEKNGSEQMVPLSRLNAAIAERNGARKQIATLTFSSEKQ